MTLVRERRRQQPLRLTLPPNSICLNPSPLSLVSTSSNYPHIDALSSLTKLSILGRGNGVMVYKVCHDQTGSIYALKVVRLGDIVEYALLEAEIFQLVDSSEYVVRCLKVCDGGRFGGLCILMGPGQKPDWVTLMFAICFGENVESVVRMGSPEFVSFCKRCLEREWRKRGTVEELLLHPFVTKSQENNNSSVQELVSCITSSE